MFLGPTGVGKSELSKVLSKELFGNDNSIIKLDMSEYKEQHSISKLIGSPPGYVGFDEGGQLTQKIRDKPYSIVLFDEIEKAHKDVYNLLLQVLEDGVLTDSQGRTASFKNSIIIFTSNVGASVMVDNSSSLGFNNSSINTNDKVYSELKKYFNPEFLNRIDDIIIFNKLNYNDMCIITRNMLDKIGNHSDIFSIRIIYNDNVVNEIAL